MDTTTPANPAASPASCNRGIRWSVPLLQGLLETLNGRARANRGRLIAVHLADSSCDQVGRPDDGLCLGGVGLLERVGKCEPAHATDGVREVVGAGRGVVVGEIEKGDGAARVVTVHELLIGRARSLQGVLVAVERLDGAKVDVLTRVGRVPERKGH